MAKKAAEWVDPTAYNLGGDRSISDPRIRRLRAFSNFGMMPLRMPFMTEVTPNLWHGGVEPGLILPDFISYKLSLFPALDYELLPTVNELRYVRMHDSLDQDLDQITELAEWVNERRLLGTVFVHCQAGLNRSSLVVAKALILAGDAATGREAIDLIRAKRDEACLCNPLFEDWVLSQPDHEGPQR
jgi:protein-tyrosine phosphatase